MRKCECVSVTEREKERESERESVCVGGCVPDMRDGTIKFFRVIETLLFSKMVCVQKFFFNASDKK